jgi:hypothetical protein
MLRCFTLENAAYFKLTMFCPTRCDKRHESALKSLDTKENKDRKCKNSLLILLRN